MSLRVVSEDLWNLYVYAVWSALNRLLPRETQEKIRDLAGEIAYGEMEKELNLEGIKDPVDMLEQIAGRLTQLGYADFRYERLGPGEINRYMTDLSLRDCPNKLRKEGAVLPEPSHAMMWAALKKRGLQSIRIEDPPDPRYGMKEGVPPEQWVFRAHEKITPQ